MQCARKGEWSRASVRRKQGIELGAGPGLAGIAFCVLGGDILLTDLPEILPLLSKNVDANLSAAALRGKQCCVAMSCLKCGCWCMFQLALLAKLSC